MVPRFSAALAFILMVSGCGKPTAIRLSEDSKETKFADRVAEPWSLSGWLN
jgi:hypothetical protein